MRVAIAELRKEFDFVIVDAPPMSRYADAIAWGSCLTALCWCSRRSPPAEKRLASPWRICVLHEFQFSERSSTSGHSRSRSESIRCFSFAAGYNRTYPKQPQDLLCFMKNRRHDGHSHHKFCNGIHSRS